MREDVTSDEKISRSQQICMRNTNGKKERKKERRNVRHTWYSVDRVMEELWRIEEVYEIEYSIQSGNLNFDWSTTNRWNE